MTPAPVVPQPGPGSGALPLHGGAVPRDLVEELCRCVFASLRRKDQRHKATRYLHGLLTTHGRKSIRNIAATVGDPAAVQSLHHFITSSTWDWLPLRAALASFVEALEPAQAWVVQPMTVPKSGERSVGVDTITDPDLGQTFRGQQAFGVWSVSRNLTVPINWRLLLPGLWGHDDTRRARADVPRKAGAETLQGCAAAAALTTPYREGAHRRPVVVNVQDSGPRSTTMAEFAAVSRPVLARSTAACRLVVADRTVPGHGAGALPAREILDSARTLRRPVQWSDPGRPGVPRDTLAAAIPVLLPGPPGARRRRLLLVGEWQAPGRGPERLWLTNMVRTPVPRLVELVKLAHRVDWDASRTGEAVGLRDFVGRSFRGWHRHITLASVAHAVTLLTEGSARRTRVPAPPLA